MYKKINIIVDALKDTNEFSNIYEHLKAHYKIEASLYPSTQIFQTSARNELFLLYLDDADIKQFFKNHLNTPLNIAIVPNQNSPMAVKKYAISKDIFEAIDDAFNENLRSKIDILMCNEFITFNKIVIGDLDSMNQFLYKDMGIYAKVKKVFSNLKNIKFNKYTLTTSKEQQIQTVATAITVLEYDDIAKTENVLSIHDGKLNAFILAPTSLLSYIVYILSMFFYQKISLFSLPKSLGFIKASKLSISSNTPMDYKLDNDLLSAKEIELYVIQDGINLHLGKAFESKVKNDDIKVDEKDSIKVNSLPAGEMNEMLINRGLPLFKKAAEDQFRELFVSLRGSAKFSYVFLTLMILSTLLATTGLFANSAPVIIGAMILAPLMAPIVSLAMGVVRDEKMLIKQSVRTLSIGIFMALLFSCVYTLSIPIEEITDEMQSRLNPNLLDLMVAFISGIAGAYAYAKEEVAKSLAGVAIAVALVPPLSVTGIGIGYGDLGMIYGSFLLFITNLIGITLSAAITFIILGYSPIAKAKKGLVYTTVLMSVISIPLIYSFGNLIQKNDYYHEIITIKSVVINEKNIDIKVIDIKNSKPIIDVEIQTTSSEPLVVDEYKEIKKLIEKKLNKKITLKVIPKIVI